MSGNSKTNSSDHNLNIGRDNDQVLGKQKVPGKNRDNGKKKKKKAVVVEENYKQIDSENESIAALSMINSMMTSSSTDGLRSESLKKITNLDRFIESVTPVVPAQISAQTSLGGSAVGPNYALEDLWEFLEEWSAYGTGVPLMLCGTYPTIQFYVPTLSGIQLYVNPSKPTNIGCSGEDNNDNNVSNGSFGPHSDLLNFNRLSLRDKCLMSDKETLVFEYMEREQPHTRNTLINKVSILASQFPELNNYRSCDLSPCSWICLAWYPIYRLSMGPSLKQLEASFLTLYSLSTQPGCNSKPSSREVRLPMIGMATYKLKGSMISPQGPECEQESALWEAAANWVRRVQAYIPDYQFFLNRYSR